MNSDTLNPLTNTPRRRLKDFVTPVDADGMPDPTGRFERAGASTIYREQGNRMIAIKFSVRDRDLASAVAEAKDKTDSIFVTPYRGMERRISGNGRGRGETHDYSSRVAGADFHVALHGIQFDPRFFACIIQCSCPVAGRNLGLVSNGNQFQHLGSGRVHLDFRRRHHGWTGSGVLFQSASRAWCSARRGDHARRGKASPTDDDDGFDRDFRAFACRTGDGHRLPDSKTVGDRGRGWYDCDLGADTISDAGAL